MITIPSGVPARSTNPSKRAYTTKKKRKIKVESICNGSDMESYLYEYEVERNFANPNAPVVTRTINGRDCERRVTSNPQIVFVGSGGYWHRIDVRDVLKALRDHTIEASRQP